MPGSELLTPQPTLDPATSDLYLSRLELNRRNRLVHTEVSDSQALHRRLLDAFPRLSNDAVNTARATHGLLYRLEPVNEDSGAVVALVQSVTQPDWSVLPPGYLTRRDAWDTGWNHEGPAVPVKPTADRYRTLAAGDLLRFRLRANPTKKIHTTEANKTDGKRPTGPNGTRKPLAQDELPEWLARKATMHGFEVIEVRDQPDPISGKGQVGWKPGKQRLTHGAVLFEGVLRVTDPELFRVALWQGIGSGKAYGFGLLSIAPVVRRG